LGLALSPPCGQTLPSHLMREAGGKTGRDRKCAVMTVTLLHLPLVNIARIHGVGYLCSVLWIFRYFFTRLLRLFSNYKGGLTDALNKYSQI
ncbi:hypothetical protein XENOCAPTIV_022154, partial [Xenoophorus captivus]